MYINLTDYFDRLFDLYFSFKRAPVSQWAKRWSTDLAVLDSIPAGSGNFFKRKRGSISMIIIPLMLSVPKWIYANSADQDQTHHKAAPDQGKQ